MSPLLKKKETADISMIKNIFSKRKVQTDHMDIDI